MKEVIYLLFHLLTTQDRALLGFWSLFLSPRRIAKSAIIFKPSTLLRFHNALKKRKYRLLYSLCGGRKPGPKRPSKEIIDAIVEMKQRNPRFGCPRIAQQINLAFGLHLDKDVVRRTIGFAVHAGHIDGPAFCWMFNDSTNFRQFTWQYLNQR